MRLRFFFPMVIFLFCGVFSQGQVTVKMEHGFEAGEGQSDYTVTPSTASNYSTTYHSVGGRSLELHQSSTEDVELVIGPFDFTQTTGNQYIALLFDHLCTVQEYSAARDTSCTIWYRKGTGNWTRLPKEYYDKTGANGYSAYFGVRNTFNRTAYNDWQDMTASNEKWKSERFNMHNAAQFIIGQSVTGAERQLTLKFVIRKKSHSGNTGSWWIDNLRVVSSAQPLAKPTITMYSYPSFMDYPNTRQARVVLDAVSNAAGFGMNGDSVRLYYKEGSDATVHSTRMVPVAGVEGRFMGVIPFNGYDTLMQFYCTARDATSNNNADLNRARYPMTENSWLQFRFVRSGKDQLGVERPGFVGTGSDNNFPFASYADNKSEWVFDSALMAQAGYGPGGITSMRFTLQANGTLWSRPRVVFKLKNVETDYTVSTNNSSSIPFTSSFMQKVYDGELAIPSGTTGTPITIDFLDTFYYAGKDLVMQIIYDGTSDNTAGVSVKTIPALPSKKSILAFYGEASMNYDPFTSAQFNTGNRLWDVRPAVVMTEYASEPLLHDMGFITDRSSENFGLVTPDSLIPMTPNDHSIKVKLMNFGALTANAIRISYSIDDTIHGYYDWSGSLAGDSAVQQLTIAQNVPLVSGFHNLKVWVEDTLTSGGHRFRDHEPLNDTISSMFVVCEGTMSGVRNIGGEHPDFNTIEELLATLIRCGMDDSLIVRLAPGSYPPFTLPTFAGIGGQNYIVFEPQGEGEVILYSDGTSGQTSIADISTGENIHFRNLKFVRRSGSLTNMVNMAPTSHGCRFEHCQFIDSLSNPAASMRIAAMLASNKSNNMVVENCTFIGGKIGVELKGESASHLSQNCSITGSLFRDQFDNAVNVRFQNNMVLDSNQMYDVMGTSNVVLLYECYGATRVTKNRIYTSHGAGALGASRLTGTQALPILIANNMMVSDYEGNSNLTSALSVSQSTWTDVVYNSVKQTAPRKSNTAAAAFGGGVQNCRFVNNVVVNLDVTNFALGYTPGTATNNTVGHNVYFSLGPTMNKLGTVAYGSIAAWKAALPGDSASISTNPNFLNGSLVDLRTFNRLIHGVGIPIASVTTDIYDTLRGETSTCPGAFEFAALRYDFEPEAMVNPEAETCYMPEEAELVLMIRNSGIEAYTGAGLTVHYEVDGGEEHQAPITGGIRAEGVDTVHTGVMLQLPPEGLNDATYTLRVWTEYSADPNQTNDTNTFTVISRYHPSTPANDTVRVDYGEAATIIPTEGVDMWQVYNAADAPRRPSQLSWYRTEQDEEPFQVGSTLTTGELRQGEEYYFRQRRAQPIVRMTQFEFAHGNNTVGVTPNAPYWLQSGRKVALQLTNVGDATAYLQGDTLQSISPNSSANNKVYVFGDVSIEPGQSLVVQFATGTSAVPSLTVHTGTPLSSLTVSYNTKIGFVYRRNGVIEDAIALNSVTTDASTQSVRWETLGVPSYVWNGAGVNITSNNTAGLIRTGFDGGAGDWTMATATAPMFISTTKPEWIRYVDNGCEGGLAKAVVLVNDPPAAELEVLPPVLPEPSCGMGMEEVSVTVRNYGVAAVVNPVVNYSAGADTVTETVNGSIPANGEITYTFNQRLNMAFERDSMVTVRVWVNAVADDRVRANDTNWASTETWYTPAAPAAIPTQQVDYASSAVLTHNAGAGLTSVWYDYEMNPVDTGNVYVSEILYAGGTMAVGHIIADSLVTQVGEGTSTNTQAGYPSPYQAKDKFIKDQYIYSAADLRNAGATAGPITSISFYLDSLYVQDTLAHDTYKISMGQTSDTIFTSNNSWKSTRLVYQRTPFVLRRSEGPWVTHELDTPFEWDGESSVVVQITRSRETGFTSGVKTRYTTKSKTVLYKNASTEPSPSLDEYVGSATQNDKRPNIRFNSVSFGCAGPYTTFDLEMVNIPAEDMAMMWPAGEETIVYNSCNPVTLHVNLRNQGATVQNGATVHYYLDTLPEATTQINESFAAGQLRTVDLFTRSMTPGRHTVMAVVTVEGDTITSNDTVRRSFVVRFCGGNYTIAPEGANYRSFSEAVDTMNAVGIEGAVTFLVADGTYQEQVKLNYVQGSSSTNTISFMGTGENVTLMGAPIQAANYVFSVDSVSNFVLNNIAIVSRPASGNYGHALVMGKGSNVTVSNCRIKVKGTLDAATAAGVVLNGDMSHLTFIDNTIDSGYYAIKSNGSGYTNIIIDNNIIRNFTKMGVVLRGVDTLSIGSNEVASGVTATGRGLTGIYLANTTGSITVQKNKVYLVDDKTGGKAGILLEHVTGTLDHPAFVVNNMISCSGTGTAGMTPSTLKPSGIWIDSASTSINVFFNTVRVYCGEYTGANNDKSNAFFSGNTNTDIQVKNNIFSNFSKGYAYYVSEFNTVTSSDYNAYYTASNKPFVWKVNTIVSLSGLQTANSDDANSKLEEPYFVSPTDLHLLMANFANQGQYNSEVPDDIDGTERNSTLGPTIGAHEMEQATHDMTVVQIINPVLGDPLHIETDQVLVQAKFCNNGHSSEQNVRWYAYLEGYEEEAHTSTRNLHNFAAGQSKTDTAYLPTPLGVVDTQRVHVVVLTDSEDEAPDNNELVATIFLKPAFNIAATKMLTSVPTSGACEQRDVIVRITLKNEGEKAIPAGTSFEIGYQTAVASPADLSVSTLPAAPIRETATLTAPLNRNATITLDFNTHVNMYPTGHAQDIEVRVTGWCHYEHDLKPANDSANISSKWAVAKSFYTPEPPVGYDTTVAYATWGAVRASQVNERPIRWYRDSTVNNSFYHPNGYPASTLWDNTPQYFHDSTYYLNCLSAKNCPSYFSEVTVHVEDPIPNDMAMVDVLAPLGNRVYMENDTVRVRIANYSPSALSNIPITYQLKKGNNVVQQVTETCTATVQQNQIHTYTFATLLDSISTPKTQQNYTLIVWTEMPGDQSNRNDTLRNNYTFKTLAESKYGSPNPSNLGFDITRLSFNEIDLDMPPLGRGYNNMASYDDPEYPPIHVTRGLQDSIIIQLTPLDASTERFRCKAAVYIDFDRSGNFTQTGENVVPSSTFYFDETFKAPITISPNASFGYMRMRVVVADYGETISPSVDNNAHIIDFRIFVDAEPPATDMAITQIVSPRDYLVRDDQPHAISFRISNKGTNPISAANFHYRFNTEQGVFDSTIVWTGNLQAGTAALVTIPAFVFPYGITTFSVWPELQGDANRSNDTLVYEYNRFHVVTLNVEDDFDSPINYWYAPTGYNAYSRNYWECGVPAGNTLNAAYSAPNAWVTDLDTIVKTGKRGNVSYLYSPIIDISQIRPDTLSFMLRRNLSNGSSLTLEFYDFQNRWSKVDHDSATHWYNNEDDRVFDKNTPNNATYERYWIPTSLISGDFPEMLQFRFVYTTPKGSNNNASFGEGCAIDDFRMIRARSQKDAGVIAITFPDSCRYGETVYPEVVIKNFGYDTLRRTQIGYTFYGTHLARITTIDCNIAPDGVDTFRFDAPFTITTDFPDTFCLNAFTILSSDIYYDNDSASACYHLLPLANDISAQSILSPLPRVIAGDTAVSVTLRMRNFGASDITRAYATYLVNGTNRVDEVIDFDSILGHPLESMEYFNYTFKQKFRAGMGVMRITAIVNDGINDYPYNDTVTKRIEGISSVTDLAANAIVLSENGNRVTVELIIENVGARGANGFDVGYTVDDNPATTVTETFGRSLPLAVLETSSYIFDATLPRRSGGYHNIKAFVHAEGDNDPTNDTTQVIATPEPDLEAVRITVEENSAADCRVFLTVRNAGNVSISNKPIHLSAVVNGTTLSTTVNSLILAGQSLRYEFPQHVDKSPTRTYLGSGVVTLSSDVNPDNNQTSIVQVVNYVEGTPSVDDRSELLLEQNRPNPYSDITTILFSLPEDADVRIFVVDIMGHLVKDFTQFFPAGRQSITLDMSGYRSGVYYYGIVAGGERRMRKMILR